MTISRRTLLTSGGALLAATSFPVISFADVRKAGSGQMEYFAMTISPEGEGAPKPFSIEGNKDEIDILAWSYANGDFRKFSEIIISAMGGSGGEDRLTENVSVNIETLADALKGANGGKGLGEGENIVKAQLKNPKWSITIKIVIKF